MRFNLLADGWQVEQAQNLSLAAASNPLQLPADAATYACAWPMARRGLPGQSLDDLLEYPYGVKRRNENAWQLGQDSSR